MRPDLRDVIEGEKPSAAWLNALKNIAAHEHVGAASTSAESTTHKPVIAPELELFQLTGNPTLDADMKEYKAQAKPCSLRFCAVDGSGHVTGTSTSFTIGKERYYFDSTATAETIWFPSGRRNSFNEPATAPTEKSGDRVWVAMSMTSKVAMPLSIPEESTWYNYSTEACPAYGVAAVTGTNGTEPDKVIQGDKPSATVRKEYIVNSATACPTKENGTYQNGEWVLAAYDTGTPALDEVWVPKAGQWTLTLGESGVAWGVIVAGIVDATNKILLGKIVEGTGGAIKWAVWDSGSNDSGAASRSFQVKECAYDGSGPTGSAFTIKTPIKKNVHTSLFADYVVGYQIEADGTKVIVTDCWDDPFGVVKQWDAAIADVPDGWSELTGARGRFIYAIDLDVDLESTGGNLTHVHDDHTHTMTAVGGPGGASGCVWEDHVHSAANHEPPWFGLYNIKRTS